MWKKWLKTDFADHNAYWQWVPQKLMWSHKKLPVHLRYGCKIGKYVKNLASTMRYKFIVKGHMIKWLMKAHKQTQRQDEYVTLLWLLLFLLSNHWDPCMCITEQGDSKYNKQHTHPLARGSYLHVYTTLTKNWPSSFLSLGSLASTLSRQSPSALCFSSRGFPGW